MWPTLEIQLGISDLGVCYHLHYSVVHSNHNKSFSESKNYPCILNILYNTEFHTSYFHFREKLIARKWAPSICWRGRFLHIQGDTRLISQNERFPLPDIPPTHSQSKCWKYWEQSAKGLSNSRSPLSSTILANVFERDNSLNDVSDGSAQEGGLSAEHLLGTPFTPALVLSHWKREDWGGEGEGGERGRCGGNDQSDGCTTQEWKNAKRMRCEEISNRGLEEYSVRGKQNALGNNDLRNRDLRNDDLVEILASLGLLAGMMDTVLEDLNTRIGGNKMWDNSEWCCNSNSPDLRALERAATLLLGPTSTSCLKINPGWSYLGQGKWW